jgi:DNA (cytosine-5)-methyltransferase 1
MWFEALRCIERSRPRFIIIEQPAGIVHNGLRAILGGLRMAGYYWDNPQIITAKEFGSPQERERVFIVAYTNNIQQRIKDHAAKWDDQIRDSIAEIYSTWGQAAPSRARMDDGVPPWLGGKSIDGWWRGNSPPAYPGVRHHTKFRREACSLYARAVCPLQAAIAIKRVVYLSKQEERVTSSIPGK